MRSFSQSHRIGLIIMTVKKILSICYIIILSSLPLAAFSQSFGFTELQARAEAGDAEAQRNLGSIYQMGQGVPQDLEQAARWYRAAAEQGHAVAQLNLAMLYNFGMGVESDLQEAAH